MEQERSMVMLKRVWESVKMYTVQCANCSKWRLIPTKEKYEEIRARIAEQSFKCETAREWRPNVSCEDEGDVKQDGSLCWAMDRPSIPHTPPGWQRIMRVRAEGGTKFADIYYVTPSNKRLRSTVEVERYLAEHPQYQHTADTSKFCFLPPIPLDDNYVSKRRALSPCTNDKNDSSVPAAQSVLHIAPYCQSSELENKAVQNGSHAGNRGNCKAII